MNLKLQEVGVRMQVDMMINGLPVEANYSEENIRKIFLPLLRRLADLHKDKQARILCFIAAPPAAGKSTLAHFLKSLTTEIEDYPETAVIGMDGFHRRHEYLLTHTETRNGETFPLVRVKGAPETFDLEKLAERTKAVASGAECGWPEYDRMLHNPVDDAICVRADIVLFEGNYLLLDQTGWRDLRQYADYTVKIEADPDILRTRLIGRKMQTGVSYEDAVDFVDFSDMANVRLCLKQSLPADLNLILDSEERYRVTESGGKV